MIEGTHTGEHILAIDPGDMSGIALLELTDNESGYVIKGLWQVPDEGIVKWWQENVGTPGALKLNIRAVIVEDFKLFKHRAVAQAGSKMRAPRGIGRVETLAEMCEVKLLKQLPDIIPGILKNFEIKMPSAHSQSHQFAALCHALYYAELRNLVRTPLELRMRKSNG